MGLTWTGCSSCGGRWSGRGSDRGLAGRFPAPLQCNGQHRPPRAGTRAAGVPMTAKRVLSVGQCAADHGSISWTLRSSFGAEVVGADTAEEALTLLRDGDFAL